MTAARLHLTFLFLLIAVFPTATHAFVICSLGWCTAEHYNVGSGPMGVAVADFDGDRFVDIAVTSAAEDKVSVVMNGADGSFLAAVDVPLANGSEPHSIVAADVDNDGDVDLVVTRSGLDDVQVLINDGGAMFTPGDTVAAAFQTPRHLAAGHLDDNGFVDVVTASGSSNEVSVLLNTGGVFASPLTYAVDGGPRGLVTAPIAGDASVDIVVATHDSGTLSVLLNQGAGTFLQAPSVWVGPDLSPEDVTAADFDGDGDSDLAAATYGAAGDFASVFFNQGAGVWSGATNLETGVLLNGIHPVAIVAADFDLTQGIDLAVTSQDSDDLAVFYNRGARPSRRRFAGEWEITPSPWPPPTSTTTVASTWWWRIATPTTFQSCSAPQ